MTLALLNASVIRTGRAILDRVTLDCEPGQFTAFCGPNGAGKTTALSVLSGALSADEGAATLNDAALTSFTPIELARRRAVVSQSSPLSFPFQVHEVVTMGRSPWSGISGRSYDSEIVSLAMAEMELTEFGARNYLTLSGGERQRVNIARALAQLWGGSEAPDSRWLLLDEPSSALDLKHQIALFALLKRLARKGWGVIAVLHDLHLVREHADRVALFKDGGLFIHGTAKEVLSPKHIQTAFDLEYPYFPR